MAGGSASSRKLELLKRRARVMELRLSGLSFRRIAEIIKVEFNIEKYGGSQAKRDTTAVIKPIVKEMGDNAQEVIALELLRLDNIQAAHWPHAIGNSNETAVSPSPDDSSPPAYKQLKDDRIAALNLLLGHMYSISNSLDFSKPDPSGDNEAQFKQLTAVSQMIKNVVSELRVESQLPDSRKPDQGAAKIILDVMARRAKLLGLDQQKIELSGGIETKADPFETMSQEDLALVIENLDAAISASQNG